MRPQLQYGSPWQRTADRSVDLLQNLGVLGRIAGRAEVGHDRASNHSITIDDETAAVGGTDLPPGQKKQ